MLFHNENRTIILLFKKAVVYIVSIKKIKNMILGNGAIRLKILAAPSFFVFFNIFFILIKFVSFWLNILIFLIVYIFIYLFF